MHNHQELVFGGGPRQVPIEQLNQNVQQWLEHANPGLAGPLHAPAPDNFRANLEYQYLVAEQERDNNLRTLAAADRMNRLGIDIRQPLHLYPYGPQRQEAPRRNTLAPIERAPPEPFRQGLGLLHSRWADRPQAHDQAPVQRNDMRLDGIAQPDINTNTNNLLHRHFDRPNPTDPKSRDPNGKDIAYDVTRHRLN